jgi:LPS sulfotransferase NodH
MIPRSGSTYFGAVLRDNGFGEFMERFRVVGGSLEEDVANAKSSNYDDYVRHKIARSRGKSSSVGFKLDWPQFVPLYYLGAWQRYFTTSHFIYLTREDILLQAISRYVGESTGIFHSPHLKDGKQMPDDVPFDYAKIESHIRQLADMMSAWERFFAFEGIAPLRLTYEKIIQNTEASLQAIVAATGQPLTKPANLSNEFQPISTPINQRLRAAFIAEYHRRHQSAAAVWVQRSEGK